MGLSSSKTSSKSTPVYEPQVTAAASNVSSAYDAAAPKISAITDQLGTLAPGLLDRYTNGDANVNAAKAYDQKVLGGDFLTANPYLDQIVAQTNDSTRNGLASSLGTRGLTGGSAFADIVSRGLAQNETGLRFNNYNQERDRQGQSASRAPALAAAGELPLASLLEIAQAQQMPLQAAAGAASGIGGLLGQYTNTTGKQSQGLGGLLGMIGGSALSGWAGGGFK